MKVQKRTRRPLPFANLSFPFDFLPSTTSSNLKTLCLDSLIGVAYEGSHPPMLRYGLPGSTSFLTLAKASAAGTSPARHSPVFRLLQVRSFNKMDSTAASVMPPAEHQTTAQKRQSSPAPTAKRRKIDETQTLSLQGAAKQTTKKEQDAEDSWRARVQEYMEKMGVQEVPNVDMPKSESGLDFSKGLWLAPMVRIGTLPTRLISLEHGADLVWGPEIVDRAIIGTQRIVNGEPQSRISVIRLRNC